MTGSMNPDQRTVDCRQVAAGSSRMDYRVHRKGRWFWVFRYHSDTTYNVIEYFPSEDDALGHIELPDQGRGTRSEE